MPKDLDKEQEQLLETVYYKDKNFTGRDRLYSIVKKYDNHSSKAAVTKWLAEQQVDQVHQIPKKSSSISPVLVKKPNQLYQMDLIDIASDAAYNKRYILTLIDAFTKQAFAVAIKQKSEKSVTNAFLKALEQLKKVNKWITILVTDNGSEFINKEFEDLLSDLDIKHLTGIVGRPQGQGIIERFNKTLKGYIQRDITVTGKNEWPLHLQQYINNYNNIEHTTIKMTPNEAESNPELIYQFNLI